MSGPRYSNAAFAVNRWAVGPQTATNVAADRDKRIAENRTKKYKASRIKAQLRPVLMRENPHCIDCGLRLQMIEQNQPNYACVVGTENAVLACRDCGAIRCRAKGAGHPQAVAGVRVMPHATANEPFADDGDTSKGVRS